MAGYTKRSVSCFGIRYRYLKLRVGGNMIAVRDEGDSVLSHSWKKIGISIRACIRTGRRTQSVTAWAIARLTCMSLVPRPIVDQIIVIPVDEMLNYAAVYHSTHFQQVKLMLRP